MSKFHIYKDGDRFHVMETLAGVDYSCDDFATKNEAQNWIDAYYAEDGTEGWYQLQYSYACGYVD